MKVLQTAVRLSSPNLPINRRPLTERPKGFQEATPLGLYRYSNFMKLSLSILGPLFIQVDEEPLPESRAKKIEALLLYLAVENGRPHRRETLVGLFFPDVPDDMARANLRQTLSRLRRLLFDFDNDIPFLIQSRESVQFNPISNHFVDVQQFQRLLDGCDTHNKQPNNQCSACMSQLQQAVALYRGPFLEGFFLEESPEFENWAQLYRQHHHQNVTNALLTLAHYYEERGEYGPATAQIRRLLELEPWQEQAYQQLLRLLTNQGQRTMALAQAKTFSRLLREELGVEPAAETLAVVEQITAAGETRPHNLPFFTTVFVGREEKLAQIHRALVRPNCRLLTIAGMGGTGKTRLALESAHRLVDGFDGPFMHGIYFVALAAMDPMDGENALTTTLATAVAEAIGLVFSGPHPPLTELLAFCQNKSLLLILDNFEHLMQAGRPFIQTILRNTQHVKLLVTSRERLKLTEEWVVDLQGLPFPTKAEATDEDSQAVQLFMNRAQHVAGNLFSEFSAKERTAVRRICQLVQGLPLAIELAAAWVHVLTCQEIAQEIENNLDALTQTTPIHDLPQRHRSIRAIFAHSWRLLSPHERNILSQLAIFRGGFGREAAAITGASLSDLAALLDKSLLLADSGKKETAVTLTARRYDMLAILRQYAMENLTPETENDLRQTHAVYFTTFIGQKKASLEGGDQARTLAEIHQDIENIRASWQWAVLNGRDDMLQTAVEGLAIYYDLRNYFQEGADVFRFALAKLTARWGHLPPDRSCAILKAQLQARLGWFVYHLGEVENGRALLLQSLTDLRAMDAANELLFNLNYLGAIARHQEKIVEAENFLQEALVTAQTNDNQFAASIALNNLGQLASQRGDLETARALLARGLTLKQAIGDRWGEAFTLTYLGRVAQASGDFAAANQLLQESLTISQSLGDRRAQAFALRSLGHVHLFLGEDAAAEPYFQKSEALFQEIGNLDEAQRTRQRLKET